MQDGKDSTSGEKSDKGIKGKKEKGWAVQVWERYRDTRIQGYKASSSGKTGMQDTRCKRKYSR